MHERVGEATVHFRHRVAVMRPEPPLRQIGIVGDMTPAEASWRLRSSAPMTSPHAGHWPATRRPRAHAFPGGESSGGRRAARSSSMTNNMRSSDRLRARGLCTPHTWTGGRDE